MLVFPNYSNNYASAVDKVPVNPVKRALLIKDSCEPSCECKGK